jgi:putative ABC transport system permease protein
VLQDIRHAIRRLRRSPGFTAVAVTTVALAIGANVAMFSFVDGILLEPLPYPEPDRIVRLLERLPSGGRTGISTLNYLDWSSQSAVFEYIAAEAGWNATLTGGDEPRSIRGARVSPQYFEIFGTRTALGRTFAHGEDRPGSDRVVVLSHRVWENRFGSDPAILGHTIALNGEAYTVIGVLERGGPFDRAAAQVWRPLAFEAADTTRDFRWLGATAKLRAGVTLDQARAAMELFAQHLAGTYPDSNKGWGIAIDRLADVVISPGLRSAVAVLFGATLLVLLIACANLANLALARGVSREGDMAVRAAFGASRWRLARHLLIEHLAIAICGGVAGIVVGYALLEWIQSLIPLSALPPAVDVRMDSSVLLFTVALTIVTGLLFGAAPAAQTATARPLGALKDGAPGTTAGMRGRRVRSTLVAAEFSLAFVLLVAAGLLMRSVVRLLDVDPGFTAADVLTAGVPISQEQHPDASELNTYIGSITAAVKALPGVREAAVTSALPLEGWGYGVPYSIAGRPSNDDAGRRPAFFKIVSPSYFHALGIRLRAGRLLNDNDVAGGPHVAVINETLARREFPEESPIGRRIVVPEIVPGTSQFGQPIAWEIVGVIAGERITGLGDEISAGLYVSNWQSPTYAVNLVVQAATPPQSRQRAIRTAVDTVNRDQALSDVRTLEQIVDQSMLATRVVSTILAAFSAIALLLAAVGIYGVMSYAAVRRTHEMGIRAALGATTRSIRLLIVWEGMRLTLAGLALGLGAMVPTMDVLSSMLYGIETYDPMTIAVVGAALCIVAVVASIVPAWWITTGDPMEALRCE